MTEKSTFRLIEVLKERYNKRGSSWSALAKAIAEESANTSKVDRRKLRRLCEGDESVALSVLELRVIDQFLRKYGEGLAENPIFTRRDDILDTVAENEELAFIVAAKYHPELRTESISRWDMRAVTQLQQTKIGKLDVEIHDIIMPDRFDPSVNDEWRMLSNRVKAPSMISIGSPLACPATEYLLAHMIGATPYRQDQSDANKRFPFYFFFPEIDESICPSTFFLSESRARTCLEEAGSETSLRPGSTRAIFACGQVFPSARFGKSTALLVAQRQAPGGHVLMALCGASGPATLGLAKVLARGDVSRQLPALITAARQPVLITVIEGNVDDRRHTSNTNSAAGHRDNRKLQNPKVICPPRLFYFNDRTGQWFEEE